MELVNRNKMKIALVVSRFNPKITEKLLFLCKETFIQNKIPDKNLKVFWVPGAYELPYAAFSVAKTNKFDAVVALGCVMKGQTTHDLHVGAWASMGLGLASLMSDVPVLFGVLTPRNEAQAKKRTSSGSFNRGREIALAAIEMIEFKNNLRRK
jgi:6,7-dimethyl-8-ribityllumazine synthase